MCVWGFFLWQQSCVFFLSSCWVWGKLLLSLFWCGCCAFSWGTCGFPRCVLQLVTFFGFRTYLARLAGLLLQWTFLVGLTVSWYTTWFSTLCQCSFPFRCLPLVGSVTFLAPVCWFTPAVEPCCWVGGVLIRRLVFYHVPCSSSGACRFRSLPCSRFPWGFSGHRVSVLLLPW